MIVQAEVSDWDRLKECLKETPQTIALHGGKYIARGGEVAVLERDDQGKRIALIEFPSMQNAKE